MTAWDTAAGFNPGDDIFAIRGQEDDRALAVFGARGLRLTHWEAQYRESPPRWPRVSHAVQRLIRAPESFDLALADQVFTDLSRAIAAAGVERWFAPLGICHPDHRILGSLLPRLIGAHDQLEWNVYDDLPYSLERPADREAAHQRLELAGLRLQPIETTTDRDRKRASIDCYRSQLPALGDRVQDAIAAAERVYRVTAAAD